MALTNIFREPRREITEFVVGIAVVGAIGVPDYYFATWFEAVSNGCPWPLGMIIGAAAGLCLVLAAIATHALGEGICDTLDRRGLRLRPANRR